MPLKGPVEDRPLAICDTRTLNKSDYLATSVTERGVGVELQTLSYSSKHQWYYFPEMTQNEVIFLKQYDTKNQQFSKVCAHGSFQDRPTVQTLRESIEVRTLVLYEK